MEKNLILLHVSIGTLTLIHMPICNWVVHGSIWGNRQEVLKFGHGDYEDAG